MSDIKVICTSDKNVALTFTWDGFTPFHLVDIEGIYGIESNVVTSENTTTDGSTYQGATAKERNIVLTVEMDGDYKENRNLLYRTFPIKRTGTMQYIEDGEAKTIDYEVENILPGATTGVVRDYTISLKCTDPYFKDLADIEVVMASWVSDFFFPACFPEEGVIFGHREAELVKEIENDSSNEEQQKIAEGKIVEDNIDKQIAMNDTVIQVLQATKQTYDDFLDQTDMQHC